MLSSGAMDARSSAGAIKIPCKGCKSRVAKQTAWCVLLWPDARAAHTVQILHYQFSEKYEPHWDYFVDLTGAQHQLS